MIIQDKQIEKLKNIEKLDDYLKNDDLQNLLLDLNDEIFRVGMDKDYNLTQAGRELQRLYDELIEQN